MEAAIVIFVFSRRSLNSQVLLEKKKKAPCKAKENTKSTKHYLGESKLAIQRLADV